MADFTYAQRMEGLTGNAIREIFKLLARPGIISFAGGMPARETFYPDVIAGIVTDLMAERGAELLQYGATEGYAPLVEAIGDIVSGLGIDVLPGGILPVSGSQQAIDLLCKALIDPGDTILVEGPTFLGALHTMRTYQANIAPVPLQDDGVDVEALEAAIIKHKPKLVYLIPTFQNPTGITMSADKRRAVAALAAKYRVAVAEDDPYRDLRYTGAPEAPIASLAHDGYVVYMGSFSKIVSPGLRVAYVAGDPGLVRKLTIGKQAVDVHSGLLNQAIVWQIMQRGLLNDWIAKSNQLHGERLAAMLEALAGVPGLEYTRPEGGLFIWATLPAGRDATALLPTATQKGVAYIPGAHFYSVGGGENALRLNFSASDPERIRAGVEILREVLK